MIRRLARRLVCAAAFLVLPAMGYAQEAVLTGTVSDSTGGVLPGVTVTAVHAATGNTFVGVTDDSGTRPPDGSRSWPAAASRQRMSAP